MKRHITTISLTIAFILAVSTALKVLPYAPPVFMAESVGILGWSKLRQMAVVCVFASLAALFMIHHNREKAQVDALALGALTLLWGLVLRWVVVGGTGWSWFEVTDYLTTAFAVPVMVAVFKRVTYVGSSCR